jgi:hypothetical protein
MVLNESFLGMVHEHQPSTLPLFRCEPGSLGRSLGGFDPLDLGGLFGDHNPFLDLAKEMGETLLERPGGTVAPAPLALRKGHRAPGEELESESPLGVTVVGPSREGAVAIEAPLGGHVAVPVDFLLPGAARMNALLE